MILIQFGKDNKPTKKKVMNYLTTELSIPKRLIKTSQTEICSEDEQYDIVICINKKNGEELKFPTVKNFLIKNKYEIFKKY